MIITTTANNILIIYTENIEYLVAPERSAVPEWQGPDRTLRAA